MALLPVLGMVGCGSISPVETDAAGSGLGGLGGGTAGSGGGVAGAAGGSGGSVGKGDGGVDTMPADAVASCMAGERRCDGDTPMTCGADGVWRQGATCTTGCSGGTCVGACTPSAKMCVGNIPQLCDGSGTWQAAPACPFVCHQGDCAGVCLPGARQCSSSGEPQTCNAQGAWDTGAACPFVCTNGVCSGVCQPGQTGCNGNVPQTCSSTGDWQSAAACPFLCSNGQCAGSCTPGTRQCSGNVPQTCTTGGAWQDGMACPFVCTGSGACSGSCVPGATQCANGQKQICDASGNWQTTTTAPVQLLANPAFDAGHISWTETTLLSTLIITPDSMITGLKAQTPSYVAWLGGYPNAQDDLSQTVTVPAGATSINLSFYYAIFTAETMAGAHDIMDVYTYDPGTATYTTVASFSDDTPTATWVRFSISLPVSLSGRSIELGFHATTDNAKNTNFFVDTVSLDVIACGP